MRLASFQSGARKGPGRGNGGRVEEGDMRTRTERPRGLWVSSQVRNRARAHRSRYSPHPPTFSTCSAPKPEGI